MTMEGRGWVVGTAWRRFKYDLQNGGEGMERSMGSVKDSSVSEVNRYDKCVHMCIYVIVIVRARARGVCMSVCGVCV